MSHFLDSNQDRFPTEPCPENNIKCSRYNTNNNFECVKKENDMILNIKD